MGRPSAASPARRRRALVNGAGVAGIAVAYWLVRSGYDVAVVERADAPRRGGYPVDIRGTALEVVRRMGVLPRLREAHVDLRRITFLEEDGGVVASLPPHAVTGGAPGRDLEVRRGDLTAILREAVGDDVEFVFGDRAEHLDETPAGVDVTFRSGGTRTFDLVVGADGMHAWTRAAVFGPEERFHRYLGLCFAVFTTPNTRGLAHETVMWNAPGRAAALYAVGDRPEVHAFLTVARPEPPHELTDPAARPSLLAG
ncbi:FAD-dependent oxidoreductase, partial [Streptomyces sp. SID5785]|nr:FAD-dependent oxidoreductase [Streptomyces sp. SID5785]